MLAETDPIFDVDLSGHDGAINRVAAAIASRPAVPLLWGQSSRRPQHALTVPDLARCLMEISRGDEVRVVVSKFNKTLRRKSGKVQQARVKTGHRRVGFTARRMAKLLDCSEKQARAMMKTLLALGLTEVETNHSAGRHGIRYATVPEYREAKPRPIPMPRPDQDQSQTVAIDPTDLPFGSNPDQPPRDLFNIPRDGSNIRD
jgi:hypothetical protein